MSSKVTIIEKNKKSGPKPKGRRPRKPTVRVMVTPKRVSLGKGKEKHLPKPGRSKKSLGRAVHTPTAADHFYTEVQSKADTRPFDATFMSSELQGAQEGTILFNQTLSAVSMALMQQEFNKDAQGNLDAQQTLISGILNYLEYRFSELTIKLIDATAGGVKGKIGVMFVPQEMKVTASNFKEIMLARSGDKPYPGSRIIDLSTLGDKKQVTINGEYLRGGRPVGLATTDKNGVVGRVVIGVIEQVLATAFGTNTPASSSQSIEAPSYAGKIAQLSFHVAGDWIFLAPGQVPGEGVLTALEIQAPLVGDTVHADPSGVGDFSAQYATGITPATVAQLLGNSIAVGQLRGAPPPSPVPMDESEPLKITFLTDSSGSIGQYFASTTVKAIGDVAVEFVGSFFPPGISQLVVWGGRTLVGVLDRIINTQDGMLAKEQTMATANTLNRQTGGAGISGTGFHLTPSQVQFTPNQVPFNGVAFSSAMTELYNVMSAAPAGSPFKNVWWMVQHAVSLGIYPFAFTNLLAVAEPFLSQPIRINDIMELFVRNVGGVSTLFNTILQPQVGADDAFAGIPLFRSSAREATVQPGYVRFSPSAYGELSQDYYSGPPLLHVYAEETPSPMGKTRAMAVFPVLDFFSEVRTAGAGYRGGSYLGAISAMITAGRTVAEIASFTESFFGHDVSFTGDLIHVTHRFTYASRAASTDGPGELSGFTPLPAQVNDSGYCTLSFVIDAAADPGDYFNMMIWEHVEHLACHSDGKHFRSWSKLGWTTGISALYWIEPDRCQSV
jgi:hypothetical protein